MLGLHGAQDRARREVLNCKPSMIQGPTDIIYWALGTERGHL